MTAKRAAPGLCSSAGGRLTRVALVVPALVMAIAAAGCAVGDPKPATHISDTGATLNADVYSSFAGDTTYFWRYGETSGYGSETTHRTIPIADDQPHPVSEPISGLTSGTTYHTQFCARDEEESPPRTNCGSDRMFETQSPDGANGTATNGTITVTVDASSGPSGENPSGTVTFFGTVNGQPGFFQGTVGCLAVDGNTAVVGYTGQQVINGTPGPFTTMYGKIVDSGTPGQDTFDSESGELTNSPDCDLYQPGGPVYTGNFTVTDAQPPEPPT